MESATEGLTTSSPHAGIEGHWPDTQPGQFEMEADMFEMERLIDACTSVRLKRELRPWLASVKEKLAVQHGPSELAELHRDKAEMVALLEKTRRCKVKQALQPWLSSLEERIRHMSTTATPRLESLASTNANLPVVAVVGASGTGKRRLLTALADTEPQCNSLHAKATAQATIATKYYRARVRYCTLDVGPEALSLDVVSFLQSAAAVVLVWDLGHPATFQQVQQVGDALGREEDEEGPERVQLCVAVEAPLAEGTLEDGEDDARVWCASNGFEHLRCALGIADLEALRKWRCTGADAGGLLRGKDTDGTALRIIEALECHAEWPGAEPITQPVALPTKPLAEGSVLPVVVVAGARGLGKRELVRALAGASPGACAGWAEGILETRYYRVRLRFAVLDTDDTTQSSPGATPSDMALCQNFGLLGFAEGLIILWDVSRPETLVRACEAYERSLKPKTDSRLVAEESEGINDERRTGVAGVRLCVAVAMDVGDLPSAPPEHRHEAQSREWCASYGFEHLHCTLRNGDFEALSRRWRSGGCGRPLLAGEGGEDGACRIVEALQCHTWPGLEVKTRQLGPGAATGGSARSAEPLEAPAAAAPREETGAVAVEALEHFMEEIRQVRAITDEGQRRERACDVAMQLAESLGIDSDEDSAIQ
mmetsp:Transcript_9252/g.25912  ORF Transcript_9252/g.25912 Transcript_9252/m.25912 type:complete len:655 (-) Transcript_9252:40-2004(-)